MFSLIQKLYGLFQKMLNLTRTVAKQGVRTFTHTTWVSGMSCIIKLQPFNFYINIMLTTKNI